MSSFDNGFILQSELENLFLSASCLEKGRLAPNSTKMIFSDTTIFVWFVVRSEERTAKIKI